MTNLIILNYSNIVSNGFNNTFRYTFPVSSINFADQEIALVSISMINSQFNIDATLYANNTFSLIIPTGSTTTTLNITMPDGYYSYTDINGYVQKQLDSIGAYLQDANGNHAYYIRFLNNPNYHACQLDMAPVPTTLPSGYSYATSGLYSTAGGLPTTAATVQLVVLSNFDKVIGYDVGTYPSTVQSTLQSFLSNKLPQINPVSSYLVKCNLVHNAYFRPIDIMDSFFTQGTNIGDRLDVKPPELVWHTIPNRIKPYLEIVILDQNLNPVKFQNPYINISLMIRIKV